MVWSCFGRPDGFTALALVKPSSWSRHGCYLPVSSQSAWCAPTAAVDIITTPLWVCRERSPRDAPADVIAVTICRFVRALPRGASTDAGLRGTN